MKIDIWFNDGRCSRCCTPAFARDLVIAKEDELVWAEYLTKKIGELLTPDAIDTPEFKAAEEKVRKDRKMALRFELRKEKEREDYYRRKVMVRPKITFIPKGLMVECSRKTTLADWDEQLKCVMGRAEAGAVTYTAAMNEGERYIADSIKAAGYPLVLLMKDGFPPVGSEEEKKYKPGGLMSDICSQGRLLLLEAYPESYEDPRIVEMTERSLTQKSEAKGYRYKELPHASLRWRSIACNEMMRMVVTN